MQVKSIFVGLVSSSSLNGAVDGRGTTDGQRRVHPRSGPQDGTARVLSSYTHVLEADVGCALCDIRHICTKVHKKPDFSRLVLQPT